MKKTVKNLIDGRGGLRQMPWDLAGDAKREWDKIHSAYHAGKLKTYGRGELFGWVKEICGLTCCVTTFWKAMRESPTKDGKKNQG
jgi:hypothetical protein